jgi:regulator of sigma E protease
VVKFTLFFLSLSLLIILHEFGHFITARWFKARVDKFYLFFDFLFPFSNVLKFSLFKKKVGETEYGIGWFPFGGYVDIAGMMGDPEGKLDTKPEPHEFRAKKPWQRLIILAGGIIVNVLLAIIIYSMVSFAYGEEYLLTKDAKYGVVCDSVMLKMGMRDGDKLISVDNRPVGDVEVHKAAVSIILDHAKSIRVDRNGTMIDLAVPKDFDDQILNNDVRSIVQEAIPFVVDSVPQGNAFKAGILPGDSIISINGDTILFFQRYGAVLDNNKNKQVDVGLYRNGEFRTIPVQVNAEGKLGIIPKGDEAYFHLTKIDYNFFESWVRGCERTWESLTNYVKQFRLLFSKAGASKIGGFASIGSLFPSGWDWQAFWNITAFLSVILAFMNLLPIPVLDGGYILFVLWEMVTGKKVSDKFMQRALTIGMYIVLALLIFANGNDIIRAFK